MAQKIIDIDTTLDISGGANDAVAVDETLSYRSSTAAIHIVIGGATTNTDVHIETRLDPTLGWADWETPSTTLVAGDTVIRSIDVSGITRLRVRAVNQDATAGNTADVRIVVTSR